MSEAYSVIPNLVNILCWNNLTYCDRVDSSALLKSCQVHTLNFGGTSVVL